MLHLQNVIHYFKCLYWLILCVWIFYVNKFLLFSCVVCECESWDLNKAFFIVSFSFVCFFSKSETMVIDDMDVNTGETTSFMLCLKPFSMHFSLKCFRNLNLCLDVKLKLLWETFLVKVALLEGRPLVRVAWQAGRPIWEECLIRG